MTTTDNGGGIRIAAAVHSGFRTDAERINERILTAFAALTEADFSRRTHFIGGRFENLYLDRDRIPKLETILDQAESRAQEILDWGAAPLRCAFWFNAQGLGQATSEHTHEELDELLSGIYYLSVPKHSGDLILQDGRLSTRITSEAGLFMQHLGVLRPLLLSADYANFRRLFL